MHLTHRHRERFSVSFVCTLLLCAPLTHPMSFVCIGNHLYGHNGRPFSSARGLNARGVLLWWCCGATTTRLKHGDNTTTTTSDATACLTFELVTTASTWYIRIPVLWRSSQQAEARWWMLCLVLVKGLPTSLKKNLAFNVWFCMWLLFKWWYVFVCVLCSSCGFTFLCISTATIYYIMCNLRWFDDWVIWL